MKIPEFLEHLPKWGEYPVPFTVMWLDGKPELPRDRRREVSPLLRGEALRRVRQGDGRDLPYEDLEKKK